MLRKQPSTDPISNLSSDGNELVEIMTVNEETLCSGGSGYTRFSHKRYGGKDCKGQGYSRFFHHAGESFESGSTKGYASITVVACTNPSQMDTQMFSTESSSSVSVSVSI